MHRARKLTKNELTSNDGPNIRLIAGLTAAGCVVVTAIVVVALLLRGHGQSRVASTETVADVPAPQATDPYAAPSIAAAPVKSANAPETRARTGTRRKEALVKAGAESRVASTERVAASPSPEPTNADAAPSTAPAPEKPLSAPGMVAPGSNPGDPFNTAFLPPQNPAVPPQNPTFPANNAPALSLQLKAPETPLEIYGGVTRSQWDALRPEEKRALLIKWVEGKVRSAEAEFDAVKQQYKAKLAQIPIPSQAEKIADQLRSALTPAETVLQQDGYYLNVHRPTQHAIDAAAQAAFSAQQADEQLARAQRDILLLAEDFSEAQVKHAKTMMDLEQRIRRAIKTYPQEGDPKLIEHRQFLLNEEEFQKISNFEKEHASPEVVAKSYVLPHRRLLNPVLKATYTHAIRDDQMALFFETESPAYRQMYVSVYKTPEGLWFLVPNRKDGTNLFLGKPPRGRFTLVAGPVKTEMKVDNSRRESQPDPKARHR
jgi:hypothetical protein